MPATGFASRTYHDIDEEATTFGVHCAVRTAANFDAQGALMVALWAATDDMVLGTMHQHEIGNRYREANPAAGAGHRELKWLVHYRDTVTGDIYRCEIGTANDARLDPGDLKHAYIGDGAEVDQFITDFEAFVLSKAGNAVKVLEITLVGKRI